MDSEPKLSKLFLTIDTITALFPLGLTETSDNNSNVEQTMDHPELSFSDPNLGEDSIFQEMPGSFSNYAHSTSRRKGSVNIAEPKRPSSKHSHVEQSPFQAKKEASATVSVEVGSVVAHIDLSLGRIMFQMIDRTLKALSTMDGASKDSATSEAVSTPPTPNSSQPSISISVKRFGVAWLEQLMTESVVGASPPRSTLDASPRDAIIRINLAMVQLASQTRAEEMRTRLHIEKFALSSVDQNMLSFESPRPRSRRSVGTSDPLKNDIEIDYQESKDRRITVVTRPVKVSLDIQSLDDALGSFGGFSGILELGNSISSANTAHSPAVSVAPARARGVHFGDTLPPVAPPEPSKMPKIHVQFGEVAFVLKGKSCALQLQTTSVRVAVRESNVRLKIAEIQLSGPYVDGSSMGPPLLIDVKGTTINFLFTPEEVDLTKLISMITPSKDPYENDEDILIDTLLRQRRKGSVLRAEVTSVDVRISDLEQVKTFEALGAELAKLSKVTKYLPDDDRPGILTLATAQQVEVSLTVNEKFGDLSLSLQNASLAHVGVPSLLAVELGKTTLRRGEELLLHEVATLRPQDQLPMVMVRIVGDEMEPVIKAKLFNVCVEYHVSTVMAALGLSDDGTADDIALGLAASVATITGSSSPKSLSRQSSQSSSSSVHSSKPLHVDLLLRSCGLGLNPRKIPAKALFIMSDAHFSGKTSKKDTFAMAVELRKASLHAIDDIGRIGQQEVPSSLAGLSSLAQRQLRELQEYGYVSLSSISAAEVQINIVSDGKEQAMGVEFKNELFVLESCADSTQTLIAILNGLQPPTPPSTAEKYRTVVPYEQMMESLHVDELMHEEITAEENFMDNADLVSDEVPTNLDFVGSFYGQELPTEEDLGDSMLGEDDLGALASPPAVKQRGGQPLLESFQEQYEVGEEEGFDFSEDHFRESDSHQEGKARKWDSDKGQYHLTNEFKTTHAPLKIRVRNVNIVWNLYDGYDWPRTRGVITQAVEDVEARAEERRQRGRDEEEDLDFVEEDFLFNSVWIGVPIKDEKGTLARQINREIDDLASETGSYATSTATRSTGATIRPGNATKTRRRKLKLERSKNKKIAIQLSDVAADVIVFPADSGQTQNSVNVRVQEFEIFDHVPSSTWSKFVTSQIEPTRREMDRPMIDLELLTVKPVTDLVASELVIQVTVQPLRLHVDQDALDFITRFFEFKDDSIPDDDTSSSEQPFIQRLEVMAVKLKLDYKPKRVDYGGLRSGHTTEFMNFVVLEDCPILLRHAIVYGIPSFDRLHKTLNDVWMPDVKRNQLPQVLTGLAAVRPVVNVASGMRDIVVVPLREYRKDGRIARSLGKGLFAFAKNTTSEAARLGAKVAIGTQNILEGAETFLNPQSSSPRSPSALQEWDDLNAGGDIDNEPRAVSNYANQPLGIKDGLRSASRRFQEDFRRAQDAIFAIPSEAMEVGSGMGMARAIARHGPTIMIRPGIGVAKAVSHTLHGVGNALDKDSKRKIDNVCSLETMIAGIVADFARRNTRLTCGDVPR
jgi:autophagy-related protein 2